MTRYGLSTVVLVALLIRLALLVVNQEVTTLPQGGSDAKTFEREAWHLVVEGRSDVNQYLDSGSDFIVLVGSYVYSATGRSPYVLGLLMILLGCGVIYLSHKAAFELWGDERVALRVAWVAALFPQLVLHSVLFLREIPVSFCLAAATLHAIRFVKRSSLSQAALFTVWVGVGALFHSGVIFAIPALLVGMLLARPRSGRGRLRVYGVNLLAALLLGGAIWTANETGFGLGQFGGSFDGAMEQFEQQELRGTEGGAAYPEWMRVRDSSTAAWKVPVRFVAFLFTPLVPFMVRSAGHLLGVLDAVLYLALFWGLYRNWSTIKSNRPLVVLLVILLALCLVYSLGVSNFGTAIRHRAKMAPILLVMAAGLPELRRRWEWYRHQASRMRAHPPVVPHTR